MANRIQLRRDNAAGWTAANTVLALGEPGYETDTKRRKIGDGTTPWTTLAYEDASYLPGDKTGANEGDLATYSASLGKFKPKPPVTVPRGDIFLGLATALKMPYTSFGVQVTGDSTSTPDFGWFRGMANDMAAAYPAITHNYIKWNDTTQDFDRPIVLNSAARRAMVMATGSTRVGLLFDGSTNINGDLDVRVDLKPPASWASGTTQILASKWVTDASWVFQLNSDGTLRLTTSADGTTTWAVGQSSTAVVPFASNTEGWVRATLTVNNGASGNDVKFYTSTDGVTWTQLGTTRTTAGVTSIFSSVSRYVLGARTSSSSPLLDGTRVYEVQIRDGINGPSVVPYLPDGWELTIGTGVATFEGAPVCTWVMSGQPGAGIGYDAATVGYLIDPLRMRKMSPHFNQLALLFNSSHNEYDLHGNLWATKYQTWVDSIAAKVPLASRIALTQNPRTGTANTNGPKIRRAEILAWAKRYTGMHAIDTFQAFLDDGRPLAGTLIANDVDSVSGVHPLTAGYTVEKNAILAELNAALARVGAY